MEKEKRFGCKPMGEAQVRESQTVQPFEAPQAFPRPAQSGICILNSSAFVTPNELFILSRLRTQ
ncbi:MAG: hypothetical protein QM523_04125 [Candidatus Pacebacteria bacterium]|nr:hypothetical protein [Candidatus Paceibacterota bacterium]